MRRRTLSLLLIALAMMGFFAQGFLASTAFQWYLKGYCTHCLKGELAYANLKHEGGVWTIEQPTFLSFKNLQDGGHHIEADTANINATIAWLERRIDVNITLQNPHVNIGLGADELKRLLKLPSQDFSLFAINSQVTIPKGSLQLHDPHNDAPHAHPIYFSVDMACKDSKEGCLSLWLSEQAYVNEIKDLEVFYSELHPNASQITLHANKLCCHKLMHALKHFQPDMHNFEITQGTLQGDAVFHLNPFSNIYAKGNFVVNDLVFDNPTYELHCHIPTLDISFSPIEENDTNTHPHTMMHANILNHASLHFQQNGLAYWTIADLKGNLNFEFGGKGHLEMSAFCTHLDRQRKLHIVGLSDQVDKNKPSMSLDFQFDQNTPGKDVSISFDLQRLGQQQNVIATRLKNIAKEEFDFVQNIVGRTHPFWQQIAFKNGLLNASMHLHLQNHKLTEIKIKDLHAENLDVKIVPWNLNLGMQNVIGTGLLDMSAVDIWQTIHSDLKISDAYLSQGGNSRPEWKFSNINTEVAIRKGIIQKTIVKTTAGGLNGEIEIDGNSPNAIAQLNFSGLASDLPEGLPEELKRGIKKAFSHDEIKLNAAVTRGYNGACITGKVFFTDISTTQVNTLDFGFALEKPFLTVNDGWFKGLKLPLEKFISPFIFQQEQMTLLGIGEFEGDFDSKQITVNYNAQDLILENSDFCIDVKNLSTLPDAPEPHLVACYTFDMQNNRSISYIPIFNGTYFEKNSGLLFYDINAKVVLEDDKAHLSNVEAFCNGIFFDGTINLDWSMPGEGVFEIDIHSHQMQGKVSQVQDFLSHFDTSLFFLKIPVEGNVEFRKQGGRLHFSFVPGDYTLQSEIFANMSDGCLSVATSDVAVQELNLDVHYDHQSNLLEFSDIQGTLLVGSPSHVEEYAITGEHICFTDYANNRANFDFSIGDKNHELLRLAGFTQPIAHQGHSKLIDFNFDRAVSHFGEVHPSAFKLTLKDWSDVEMFQLDLEFKLQTLLRDLQRFSRTGLFFLSRSLLKEINDVRTAQGDLKVNLEYDGQKGILTYDVAGNDAAIDSYTSQQFLFNGKKKESTWIIDQLQFDNISLAADILKDGDVWNINFLGARFGKSLLLGMEGQYKDDDSTLNAKINLFEADLAYLEEWPALKAIFEEYHLAGQMRANGTMQLELNKSLPQKMRLHAHLNCALRNGKWRGLHFQNFENASLDYTSDKGISFNNINTALKSAKDGSVQATLFLKSTTNDFNHDEMLFDSIAFQVPSKNLNWLSENLQQSFPDLISPPMVEIIQNLKSEGEVKGQLKFEFSQPHCALRLTLDDGIYHFMQRDHDVSFFVLEYDPFELKISSKYRFERHQFWLTARSPAPAINKGEIILSEQALESYHKPGYFPLTINWEKDPAHGLIINKIEGSLCGIKCDLTRDSSCNLTSDQLFLAGEVHVNLAKAQALINPDIAAICANWEIGHGYSLKGQWALAKDNRPFNESLTFQGELIGRDFELAGYQFFHLSGQVGYSGNALRVANVTIDDPSGNLLINDIMLSKKTEDHWSVDIPAITINNFRPSLLHVRGEAPPSIAKALVFRQLDLRNFQGILGDRKSYSGKGRFLFANPPKRNLQHTIFALPAELMTRLGLDFGVLNPVRGLVFYEVKDSKIVFTRFKDVYSKGRLSKFYLSNSGFQSHMDFDGNLNVQIRMKQYNLFFKLAELFTVTVQGNIKKPSYSLQRQTRSLRNPLL